MGAGPTPGAQQPAVLMQLGLLEAQQGRLDEAAALFARASIADAANPAPSFNLGLVRQQQGRHAEALAAFDAVLGLSPQAAPAHHARGLALKNLQRLDEALAAYDAALALQPGFAAALNNRAAVLLRLGRADDAIASYRLALEAAPRHAGIWANLGAALHEARRHEEAFAAFMQAREHGDSSAVTLMNAGVSLNALHRHAQALALLQEALKQAPGDLDVRLNLGNALAGLDRWGDARAQFELVLRERPGDADAALNLANTLRDSSETGAEVRLALPWYERALENGASPASVRWNRALCLLSLGEFEAGWVDYEERLHDTALNNPAREPGARRWRGEPVAGATVLLHAEQGLGDTLQFCRYARLVAARGARVVLEVQAPLKALLTGLDGVDHVVARGEPLPQVDWHCPLMSLPQVLGTTRETIPGSVPYLQADPVLVARWRGVLAGCGRPQVGVAWSGSAGYWNDHRRSIAFETFRAALPSGIDYWSLQKDTPASIGPGQPVRRFDETAFTHTAAQIMALDLVVTVDTSIGHLAGALGRPVWILLSQPADMRWMLEREDSPWYASARLLRQHGGGGWSPVLARLAHALEGLAAAP